jgi:hypothetical protein
MQANPDKPIRYIVGLCGLPSREEAYVGPLGASSTGESVPSLIYETLGGNSTAAWNDRFSVAEYGPAPVIAWLDCGSYAATVAYVDKEAQAAAGGGLKADGVTISGGAGGVGPGASTGTTGTYVIDDENTWRSGGAVLAGEGFETAVEDYPYIYAADTPLQQQDGGYPPTFIPSANNPTAYVSWGEHDGDGGAGGLDEGSLATGDMSNWTNNGQVTFTGKAGWWVGFSIESYNGVYPPGYAYMGNPATVFSATAFLPTGGTPYSCTPVCWVGATQESGSTGTTPAYFTQWAQGWSSLEAAWSSSRRSAFPWGGFGASLLVVTDICLVQ